MTSTTTSSGSGDAFDRPNASNQSATNHFSEDSPAATPSEANAPDLLTRAESEPETQVVDQSPDFSEDDNKLADSVTGEENSQEAAMGEKANPAESMLACMVEKTGSTQRTNQLADNQRQY
jgi:hypothetical protein